MPDVIYLNGERVGPEQAVVPIDDRGFLFGDAVYEVLRSYEGRLWAVERHFRRLQRSLEEVGIVGVDLSALREVVTRTHRESGYANAVVYLHITAGVELRALARGEELVPMQLVRVRDADAISSPEVYEKGVRAISLPDLRWKRCDIKSTNLLPNVLARTQARRRGAYEAILYDEHGYVTEAASMSVLGVEGGALHATPLGPEILPGISREFLLEIARELGLPVHEEMLSLARLRRMDEILLTSTSHEVCPVIELDDAPVGTGQVGLVAPRLLAGFRARIAAGRDGELERGEGGRRP